MTAPRRLLLVNGPNLNLLGTREPGVYGSQTLADVEALVAATAAARGFDVDAVQSNHEGVLIDAIHAAREDCAGIVINPGGLTHTSVVLRDALVGRRAAGRRGAHHRHLRARGVPPPLVRRATSPSVHVIGEGVPGYATAVDAAHRRHHGPGRRLRSGARAAASRRIERRASRPRPQLSYTKRNFLSHGIHRRHQERRRPQHRRTALERHRVPARQAGQGRRVRAHQAQERRLGQDRRPHVQRRREDRDRERRPPRLHVPVQRRRRLRLHGCRRLRPAHRPGHRRRATPRTSCSRTSRCRSR